MLDYLARIPNIFTPTLVFYGFALMTVLASSMVVFSRHPVRAALFLVLAFFGSAGLWLLMEAEFLALVLVLVYVGAVMTLFLFVIMTLNTNLTGSRWGKHLPIGLLLVTLLVAALFAILKVGNFIQAPVIAASASNVQALGSILYTQYAYPFELAAILLLLAIIAAISLDLREQRNRKVIIPEQQILVRREERVRIVKMKTEGRDELT